MAAPKRVLTLATICALMVGAPTFAQSTNLDTRPPGAPPFVQAVPEPGGTAQVITWGRATDDVGVASYAVLRNGVEIARTVDPRRRLILEDLPHGTSSLQVQAIDAAGNMSVRTRPIAAVVDRVAPSVPNVFTPVDNARTVSLFGRFPEINGPFTEYLHETPSDPSGIRTIQTFFNGRSAGTENLGGRYPDDQRRLRLPRSGTAAVQIRVQDASGNWSPKSAPVVISAPVRGDGAAPSAVSDVSVDFVGDAGTGRIELDWTAATDNTGVAQYLIVEQWNKMAADYDDEFDIGYFGNGFVGDIDGSSTSFSFEPSRSGENVINIFAADAGGAVGPPVRVVVDVPASPSRIVSRPTMSPGVRGGSFGPQRLSWARSDRRDTVATRYHELSIDGVVYDTTSALSLDIVGLSAGEHTASVVAIGADGTRSRPSRNITFNSIGPIDLTPEPPIGPVAAVDGSSVSLRFSSPLWASRVDPVRYRVVGDDIGQSAGAALPAVSANDVAFGNDITFDDLAAGTYTVQIIHVDNDDRESPPSSSITFTIRDGT